MTSRCRSLLLLTALILCGCKNATTSSDGSNSLQPFVGEYYRGDGLGYNISLDLKPNGSYHAVWTGCLGVYGQAQGTWSVSGNHILLVPTWEKDLMEGYLRQLDPIYQEGKLLLVQHDDRDFYDKHGASRFSCFQRTKTMR